MGDEERDELRRGLRAAGCEWLLNRLDAGRYCSQELEELRSLLRREVWVVQRWESGTLVGVCSTEGRASKAAEQLGPWATTTEKVTIDAEVPDEQG